MEQREQPSDAPVSLPHAGASVVRWKPSVEEYLRLYRSVGEAVQWDEHLRLPSDELRTFLQAETTWISLLRDGDKEIGLCEAVRLPDGSIRITHFGLVPSVQGLGLGRFLLDDALRALWRERPCRIWLNTDTNDHPAAVRTYARAGFAVSGRDWKEFPD